MTVNTWNVASGATLYAGRNASSGGGGGGTPAWASPAVLNKALTIPNTAGFGGSVGAFSGWAKKNSTLVLALASGHSAGFDNRVVSLDYMSDAPTWTVRIASSTNTSADTAYYPDLKPAGRHTYQMLQYVAALDCFVTNGVRFTHPNASTFANCDALDVSGSTWTWKTAGYISNVQNLNGGGVVDYDGKFHAAIFDSVLDPITHQWTQGVVTIAAGYTSYAAIRHPWATDVAGRKVFGISMGDGEGFESGLRATVMRNNVRYPVAIAPGAALTQFMADFPKYCGMDFDSINNRFTLIDLHNRRFYNIAVASDNSAVMSFYTPDMSGVILPPLTNDNTSETNTRFTYDATLKGFLCGPALVDMFFIKTSA